MQAQAAKPARKTANKGARKIKTAQAAAPISTALVVAGELRQLIDGNDVQAARAALLLPAPAPIILDGADLVREVIETPTIQAADADLIAEVADLIETEQQAAEAPADFTTSTETEQAAPTMPTSTETLPYSARLLAALKKRYVAQPSKDVALAVSACERGARALDLLYARPHWLPMLEQFECDALVHEARDARFIGVKVLVKIVHALTGVGAGIGSYFDPYSRTICANLAAGVQLTNKGALVALSRAITFDALDTEQHLIKYYNCKPSTANTQASSSRMMLRALNVCAVVKGKTNDQMTVLDNQRAVDLFALFIAR